MGGQGGCAGGEGMLGHYFLVIICLGWDSWKQRDFVHLVVLERLIFYPSLI